MAPAECARGPGADASRRARERLIRYAHPARAPAAPRIHRKRRSSDRRLDGPSRDLPGWDASQARRLVGYEHVGTLHAKDWILDLAGKRVSWKYDVQGKRVRVTSGLDPWSAFNRDCCLLLDNLFSANGAGIELDEGSIRSCVRPSAMSSHPQFPPWRPSGTRPMGALTGSAVGGSKLKACYASDSWLSFDGERANSGIASVLCASSRPHAAAHVTTRTLLLKAGVPSGQRILRHSDPKLTAMTYGHLEVEDMRRGLERLPIASPPTGTAGQRYARGAKPPPFRNPQGTAGGSDGRGDWI